MTIAKEKLFYWSPRALGILYILFIAIFALDVFVPGRSLADLLLALFMHLMPNYLLALILFIAWKKECLGGWLFLLLFIVFSVLFRNPAQTNLIVFGPLLLIGSLFLLDNYFRMSKE